MRKSNNPSCTDLIPFNNKEFFLKSCTVEVEISDHHYLLATFLKSKFIKGNPKTKFYRNYKNTDIGKIDSQI